MYWINPDRPRCKPDTLVFDVDGVLLDDTASFRQAVIATVEYLTAHLNPPPVTIEDVAAFKRAGGLNNDWDMAYALVALVNGLYQDHKAADTRPSLPALAEESQGRGLDWVRSRVPPEALPDYEVVKQVLNEFYWGTDLLRERLGETPRHLESHRGFVWQEPRLIPSNFLTALRDRGVSNFAIVTGRNRAELAMGLELLQLTESFDCIVTAEDDEKPNPAALWRVVRACDPRCLLYVGDTRDDLELVKNFKATAPVGAPLALSAIVSPEAHWAYWQGLGADIVMATTTCLVPVLTSLLPQTEAVMQRTSPNVVPTIAAAEVDLDAPC